MNALDLFGTERPTPSPDNADPHPVVLHVTPREVWAGQSGCTPRWWEADYEIEIDHPSTCSAAIEECPVADYLEVVGIDQELYAGFPEPDWLSDEDLAALDGTVRFITMTRHHQRYDSPNGTEYDVDYAVAWSDQ